MKKTILLSAVVASSLLAIDIPEYEIAPNVTHAITEGNAALDNYNMLGLTLSKKVYDNTMLSFSYSRGESDYQHSNRDTDINLFSLNGDYYFFNSGDFYTFATAGISYQHIDNKEFDRDNEAMFNYGVGVKYALSDMINIYAKAAHFTDFADDNNELHLTTGLGFSFGKTQQAPVKTQSLQEQAQELDSDNDGVVDTKDNCPDTPQGAPVDTKGCALDSDNDGVIDLHDRCQGTPLGYDVDAKGCIGNYDLDITFGYDLDTLNDDAIEQLSEFALYIKANKETIAHVEIGGHTDSIGSASYNQTLSQKRAKSVYDALIGLNISKDLLSYKGYGEEKPKVANDTEKNRATNRRIEATITRSY